MFRSPGDKHYSTHASAPDLHKNPDETSPNENITLRSVKRRRCDCGFDEQSKLDTFIDTLTSWQQESDAKLARIQDSINEMKRQNLEILATNAEIEKSIDYLSSKYDDICDQLKTYQAQTKACNERLTRVEDTAEEIERFSRSSSLEIRNLPLNQPLAQDELVSISLRIFKELSIVVQQTDVYDIRFLPTKKDKKTILVTLNSVILKNSILKAYRVFNRTGNLNSSALGPDYPRQTLYLSENLTARARRLFFLAREFSKAENYKHCWTANGRVLLRKQDNDKLIVLTSESQLNDLSSKN